MHLLAFLGVLAILVVRIAHPPAEPVPPPVGNAAELTPEQRARAGADSPAPGTPEEKAERERPAAARN